MFTSAMTTCGLKMYSVILRLLVVAKVHEVLARDLQRDELHLAGLAHPLSGKPVARVPAD
jgi:hypothetical protein